MTFPIDLTKEELEFFHELLRLNPVKQYFPVEGQALVEKINYAFSELKILRTN